MVEPIDPFQSGEFHRFEVPPWPAPIDDLGLVETDDRFGEGVIVTIADASNRRLNASMRDNWLSNRVFKSYENIVDHCCHA